ncbi:hypothetical protein MASR2M15_19620 [Anaerolineales bacterium]
MPQSEHGRLAGILASLWGNSQFDRPSLDRHSFITGVSFHDRGYGWFDNSPIGQVPLEEWFLNQERGIKEESGDPIVEMLVILHLKRLLSYNPGEKANQLIAKIDQKIENSLAKSSHSLEEFLWADRITQICDKMAFDFSFEADGDYEMACYRRQNQFDELPFKYQIKDGRIQTDPWVFAVDDYSGFIYGFESDPYPEQKQAVVMPFHLTRQGLV